MEEDEMSPEMIARLQVEEQTAFDEDAAFDEEFRRDECVEIQMDSEDDMPPDEDGDEELADPEDEGEEIGVIPEQYSDDDVDAGNDDAVAKVHHKDAVLSVAICPTDRSLIATSGQDDLAVIWSLQDGPEGVRCVERSRLEGHTDSVTQIAFSADGQYVATGSYDCSVKIWVSTTGQLAHVLEGPAKEIEWIIWHPKGHAVLAGSADTLAWMWWAPTGKLMQCFASHAASVSCGAWALGGKAIVTGSEDHGVIVWNPRAGTPTHHFRQLFSGGVVSICSHPELPVVVAGSEDASAKVLQIETGKELATLPGHTDSVEAVGFSGVSATGVQLLATGAMDGKVFIWDAKTFDLRCSLNDHFEKGGVVRMKWLPPSAFGLWLCTCSTDQTLRLFDALSGRCMRVLRGHSDSVLDLDLALAAPEATGSGGMHQLIVVSGSDDKSCRIFVVPLEQVVAEAKNGSSSEAAPASSAFLPLAPAVAPTAPSFAGTVSAESAVADTV